MKPTTVFFTLATLASSFSLIAAQDIAGALNKLGVSKSCQTTLGGFVTSTEVNTCIPFVALAGVALPTSISGAANLSSTINNAVATVCQDPVCSDSVVSNVLANLTSGCSTDLAQNNPVIMGVKTLISFYTPIRQSLCFKNSTGGYCVLEDVEFAKDILVNTTSLSVNSFSSATLADTTRLCSNCNKAIINTIYNFEKSNPNLVPSSVSQYQSQFQSQLTSKCGSTFLDGQVPATTDNAVTNGKSNSGSSQFSQHNMYFASLAVMLVYLTIL